MNVVSIDVCGIFFISLYGCYWMLGDISFHYCLYGWCAIHNGFMNSVCFSHTCIHEHDLA